MKGGMRRMRGRYKIVAGVIAMVLVAGTDGVSR